jgi:hypothetical protein
MLKKMKMIQNWNWTKNLENWNWTKMRMTMTRWMTKN